MFGGGDIGGDHGGNALAGQPEKEHGTFRWGSAAFAVAAPRRLQNGIQPGFLPVHDGKIHIHPGLDQGGGYHPAGLPGCQPGADLLQQLFAVGGAEQRGQAIAPLTGQRLKKFLRGFAPVDNAEHLRHTGQRGAQSLLFQFAQIPQCGPAKRQRLLFGRGTKFPDGQIGGKLREQILQGGLCRGTQYRRGAVMLYQLGNRRHAGAQIGQRQILGLVKDDDTVGKVVQLAAAGGPVGKQRFKKLDRGGDNNRHIPVFRCQHLAIFIGRRAFAQRILRAGMMLQHVFFPQNAGKNGGVLLDDGGVGNDINHAVHFLCCGKRQRKPQ